MSAAGDLRALHVPGDPLVLPNAWDAATARLVQEAGFPVVATTSSGVAEALGLRGPRGHARRRDARRGPRASPARSRSRSPPTWRAATASSRPSSPSGPSPPAPSGLNFEDTDHRVLPRRSCRRRAAASGSPGSRPPRDLVVNARIDTVIRGGDLEEALARAAAYRDAGADCVYPIGVTDEGAIARFVALERAGQHPALARARRRSPACASSASPACRSASTSTPTRWTSCRERLVSLRGPSA